MDYSLLSGKCLNVATSSIVELLDTLTAFLQLEQAGRGEAAPPKTKSDARILPCGCRLYPAVRNWRVWPLWAAAFEGVDGGRIRCTVYGKTLSGPAPGFLIIKL